MSSIDLHNLGTYLSKENRKIIYLSFEDIENIIENKLPPKACSANWWYNVPKRRQAEAWLSNGYMTIEANTIPIRKGVAFEKYTRNKINKIKYNRFFNIFLQFIIFPILVAIISSLIWYNVTVENELNEKISIIKLNFSLQNYDGIENNVYELIPRLEERSKYKELCDLYDILFTVYFSEYTSANVRLCDKNLYILSEFSERGIYYANKIESAFYKIRFYNNLGMLYQFQYNNSLDIKDAQTALKYLFISDNIYEDTELGPIPIKGRFETVEELNIALLGLEANSYIFDIYYSLIENGEYSESDYKGESIVDLQDGVFIKWLTYYARTTVIIGFLNEPEYFEHIINSNKTLIFHSLCQYERVASLLFILTRKFEDDFFLSKESFSYENAKNYLKQNAFLAQQRQDYSILSATYLELARINYMSYVFEGNEIAIEEFNNYLTLYLEITDREDLTLIEFEKYFSVISSGDLLDLYIIEVENTLENISFLDNPSLYSYTKWELGKHYYFKALDLINHNESTELIKTLISYAKECCNSALIFFTYETNEKIYNEIQLLLSNINTLN